MFATRPDEPPVLAILPCLEILASIRPGDRADELDDLWRRIAEPFDPSLRFAYDNLRWRGALKPAASASRDSTMSAAVSAMVREPSRSPREPRGARQEALFGPVPLPPNGAHVVARGCGNQVWALQPDCGRRGTIGNGGWGGPDHEWHLVRLPAAAEARESEDGLGETPVYFDDSEQSGNLFHGSEGDRDEELLTEADLVEEVCVAKQGNPAR